MPRLSDMARPHPPTHLDPQRTWVVLVGILDYPRQGFATRGRQDLVLDQTLATWGVPDAQRRVLLDRRATASAIRAALDDVVREVGRGDTLLFYFAGHGDAGHDGVGFLAHDRALPLKALTDALRNCRASVLLAADCCFSGSLADVGAALHRRGIPTAVLASIDGSTSTLQWTFTRTLIDAFAGRAFVDHDRDGRVSLADLAHEQRAALRARDTQRAHASWHGLSPQLVLRAVADADAPDLGWCELKVNRWRPARVVARVGDAYRVRLCDIETTRHLEATPDRLRPLPQLPTLPVGTEVWATPEGGPRATARVVAVEDGLHLVAHDDPTPLAQEWLPAAQLTRRDPQTRERAPGPRQEPLDRDTRWRLEIARLQRAAKRRGRGGSR